MRRLLVLTASTLAAFALSAALAPADAGAKHHKKWKKDKADFALFDATNPDNAEPGGVCGVAQQKHWGKGGDGKWSSRPWTLHVAVSNNDTTTRSFQVVYKDGDWVRYYVPAQSSFALTQAAGSSSAGGAIRIFVPPGGQLSGSVSAQAIGDTKVFCRSCDDTDGAAACDEIIPFP